MHKKIKDFLDYRVDGKLVWKKHWYQSHSGDLLRESMHPKGYYYTEIFAKRWLIHRLIWFWHNGELPQFLDHINRNRLDNRIENLRPATVQQNAYNSIKKNKNGYRGVTFHKPSGLYMAFAAKTYLGYFKKPEDAAKAYDAHIRLVAGDFAICNF